MREDSIIEFHTWFDSFIGKCHSDEKELQEGIERKKEHTLRVYEIIQRLGQSIGLSKNDFLLAETIALFHDVGRFYQYTEYKTVIDFIEPIKDHADLGVIVLEHNKVLEALSQEEREIVLKAIKYHNLYELPKTENERVILFSKLIRDADKLDIYKVHVRYFEEKSEYHEPILRTFPDIPEYTIQNIQDILDNRCPVNANLRTYNDLKLTYISWIFDVNFYFTIKQIIDNKYIERLISVLPNTEDINKIHNHISDFIDKKIQFLV